MTDMTTACPNCNSSTIRKSSARGMNARIDATNYRCADCGHRFDEPVRRESETPTGPRDGLARRLADADPDASLAELAEQGGESV